MSVGLLASGNLILMEVLLTENINIKWTQIRTDLLKRLFRCGTLHLCGRAFHTRAWAAWRAHGRFRALHFRAAWARAWRAITLWLRALGAVEDDRLLLWNAGFEDILA
jgi:hypothetical protein